MKYVTLGPDGKGYCLPFIHNWAILNVKPVGENATEATVHLTTKLHSILSSLSQPAERNMCYVVYQSARRRCTLTGFVFKSAFPNCCSLSNYCFFPPTIDLKQKTAQILCFYPKISRKNASKWKESFDVNVCPLFLPDGGLAAGRELSVSR